MAQRERAEDMSIAKPRDQQAAMQVDWDWILKTLQMCQDRALTGTPLYLRHSGLYPNTVYARTLREGVKKMIDDVFSTAVVEKVDGR
jgi:hypothetical protein